MADHRDPTAARLGRIATGTTEGTISGGNYTFDPDTIRQVIKNWTDLAENYAYSVTDSRPMTTVGPPGNEYASESFAAKANASGASYVEYCQRNMAICLREAQRYQDALDTYLGVEDRTVISIGQTDDSGSTPVL